MKYNQQESRWQHGDDCLSFSPLATGRGYWHCTCGYDKYLEAVEDNHDFEAENERLRAGEWLWGKMSELRISTISFDYGMGMIAAFDFDNESIAEAETLERIFEIAQGWEINQQAEEAQQ